MTLNEISELFDYTEWANRYVLDAVAALPVEQQHHDFKISHGSIFGTLAHMAGAEMIWLSRWRESHPSAIWKADDFEDLAALRREWSALEDSRHELLAGLRDDAIARPKSYRNLKGEEHSLPLIQHMQHVVNHATLHRGQVVGMIRQLGAAPPAVDLLYYFLR